VRVYLCHTLYEYTCLSLRDWAAQNDNGRNISMVQTKKIFKFRYEIPSAFSQYTVMYRLCRGIHIYTDYWLNRNAPFARRIGPCRSAADAPGFTVNSRANNNYYYRYRSIEYTSLRGEDYFLRPVPQPKHLGLSIACTKLTDKFSRKK